MTATAIAKAFRPNEVMTLGELYALLAGLQIKLGRYGRRGWVARRGDVEVTAATPMGAVVGLLKRIGEKYES